MAPRRAESTAQLPRLVHFEAGKGVSNYQAARSRRVAVNNLVAVHGLATPQELEAGRTWYDRVHDATEKGVRRLRLDSSLHGAGIVAAVSPNMDWESRNISAFGDVDRLSRNPEHLRQLQQSMSGAKRSPEFLHTLRTNYPSISSAPDTNIAKALRIRSGEHPDEVLSPRTAPKTNSFAHNIADPSATVNPHSGHALVTIDGRAHDVLTNRMLPWESTARGISSAVLTRGTSRYEHMADIHAQAARVVSADSPHVLNPAQMQATIWTTAKRLERPGGRAKGVARHEQPYLP